MESLGARSWPSEELSYCLLSREPCSTGPVEGVNLLGRSKIGLRPSEGWDWGPVQDAPFPESWVSRVKSGHLWGLPACTPIREQILNEFYHN